MNLPISIYRNQIMHRRHGKFAYVFRYSAFSLLLDIDKLEEIDRISSLFSINRFNLFSFYPADHLPQGCNNLRSWLNQVLCKANIEPQGIRVRLQCMPRMFGWQFNPLSIWYCERDGQPIAAVCEVHNTFGERHCYLLPADHSWPIRGKHAKCFHVSPFMSMSGDYHFKLHQPGQTLGILIQQHDHQSQPLLSASQLGERHIFNTRNLLIQFMQIPLLAVKVLSAIHWQALKIWLRGARYHRRPAPPLRRLLMSTTEIYPSNLSPKLTDSKHAIKNWGLRNLLLKQIARLEYGQLQVQFDDGTVQLIEGNQAGPSACIQVHKPAKLLQAILGRGALGLAESYMQGDWSTGNLTELLYMLLVNQDAYQKLRQGSFFTHLLNRFQHRLNRNSRHGSRRNIAAHYDLGNDFYAKWLDSGMSYSSAIFDTTTDLEAAQQIKYANLLNSLDPQPGAHILEIGCGWGGFVEYAAKWGMQVTAVTLSQEQFDYSYRRIQQAGLQNQVTLKLADYRTLDGQFDHIVSIEMFEAVGQQYWATYFDVVNRCLKPGGKVALQVITIDEAYFDDYCRNAGGFIQKYIFPGGMLPTKTHLREHASQVGLETIDMAGYGEHYADTLSDWQDAFQQQTDWLQANGYDERFRRMWNYYLSYCEAGFRESRIDLIQISLQKFCHFGQNNITVFDANRISV